MRIRMLQRGLSLFRAIVWPLRWGVRYEYAYDVVLLVIVVVVVTFFMCASLCGMTNMATYTWLKSTAAKKV